MTHNELTNIVIGTSIEIHRRLGPGLLENVYKHVLAHELRKRGLRVETEVPIPVIWDGEQLEVGFRADIIVESMVVVELKSVEAIHPIHRKITGTYLRLMDKRLALLINFGVETLRDGIHRIVNDYQGPFPSSSPSGSLSASSAPPRETRLGSIDPCEPPSSAATGR